MASIARKPTNFYVNVDGSINHLTWDKVLFDIDETMPHYINVLAYYVYATANPNGSDFGNPVAIINTDDPYSDKDIFWTDYSGGNKIYKVCPLTSEGIGQCSVSYGIVNAGEITTPEPGLWDLGLWDSSLWGF